MRDESQRYCTAVVLRCRRRSGRWSDHRRVRRAPTSDPRQPRTAPKPVGRHGTLLGLLDHVTFHDVDLTLDESMLLIAYTDGISEARRDNEQLGEEALVALIGGVVDRSPAAVLDTIVETALQFGGSPNRDDMAAIALRPSSDHGTRDPTGEEPTGEDPTGEEPTGVRT